MKERPGIPDDILSLQFEIIASQATFIGLKNATSRGCQICVGIHPSMGIPIKSAFFNTIGFLTTWLALNNFFFPGII